MSLFTSTETKEFSQKVKNYESLIQEEHLSMEDVIKKKQYIQVCSLKLDSSNHSYDQLATILNIPKTEVEEWAIEAIAGGIIDAKIDQLNEEIVIRSHIMNQELNQIQDKLQEWSDRFTIMQAKLSAVKNAGG